MEKIEHSWYNDVTYYHVNDAVDCIYYHHSRKSYPLHTHANHIIFGYVVEGAVRVISHEEIEVYREGQQFCIMQDVLHGLEAVGDESYSMLCLCVRSGESNPAVLLDSLKQAISDAPERTFRITDMARRICISPYHMIRRFKADFGLTPHQFQIQCRVRKAQKLLEEGKSVVEAACDTGFCDQSHFDRCFYKIVRLTPSEYRQAVVPEC